VSLVATHIVVCDDCSEPLDDGDHGHRTAEEARRIAKGYGAKRRRMSNGKWYDVCLDCDEARKGPPYNRTPPRHGGR
jgi:hypothetical protein